MSKMDFGFSHGSSGYARLRNWRSDPGESCSFMRQLANSSGSVVLNKRFCSDLPSKTEKTGSPELLNAASIYRKGAFILGIPVGGRIGFALSLWRLERLREKPGPAFSGPGILR